LNLQADNSFKILSKRELIEIPLGENEALLPAKLRRLCVDGKPHKSIGTTFTPGVVRSGDEPAKRQGLLTPIRSHNPNDRPAEHAPAIRCFPHAVMDESGARIIAR
jgi:hypothetical protein